MKASIQGIRSIGFGLIGALSLLPILLQGAVISVPRDFATIKSAVAAARNGDIVEVDDGTYFEENIVVGKAVHIRAKNPYRAIIHGSYQKNTAFAIFIVRAAAEIEGFILKNSYDGIVQRDSLDVLWTAHDLIILNMDTSAININAVAGNVGRARISEILVDNATAAFSTNDANSMEVKGCSIFNCQNAVTASNHLSFSVDDTLIWNCGLAVFSNTEVPPTLLPPATNTVVLGSKVKIIDSEAMRSGAARGLAQTWPGREDRPAVVQAYADCAMADGFLQAGRLQLAETLFRSARQKGEGLRNPEILWRSSYGLGVSLEHQGRLANSLDSFRQAIQSIAHLQGPIPRTVFYSAYLKDKLAVIGAALRVLERMPPKMYGEGPAVEALNLIEQTRARGILDSLQEAIGSGFGRAWSPAAAAEERSLSRTISKIQIELKNRALSDYRRQALIGRLEKAEQAYLDFLIRPGDPADANRPSMARPLSYSVLREILLSGPTVLIEYFFIGSSAFGLLASSQGVYLARLPATEEIAMKVQDYLSFLRSTDSGGFEGRPGGRILADMLIEPFLDRIPPETRRLIIVPDGLLWTLPFEALVLPERSSLLRAGFTASPASQFLVERFEVVYAPSASCLASSVGRKRRIWKKDWLGLACSNDFPAPILTLGASVGLPGLPWVTEEIKLIGALFSPDRRLLLFNGASGEKTFKEINLEEFRIIHLATHGILDDINWRRSALLFKADERAEEDGLLQPREIASLRLKADLVVLSACRSARGSYESGEGLKGLSLAFLTTGAKSVLAGLWAVSDRSTPVFMKSLYHHLGAGAGKARALQLAKMDMLRSRYSHPFYWAGFVLLGDWGGAERSGSEEVGSIDDK